MADIALVFSESGIADLVMSGQDLLRDDGLESAVFVSLFCDRRARPDQIRVEDDRSDVRGFWGDVEPEVPGDKTGSLLWLLRREKQTPQTLTRAREYAQQALDWMVLDRVAKSVSVEVEYIRSGFMGIRAEITRPDASRVLYLYDYEWTAQAAKRVA